MRTRSNDILSYRKEEVSPGLEMRVKITETLP
jgi:hypothetical protein